MIVTSWQHIWSSFKPVVEGFAPNIANFPMPYVEAKWWKTMKKRVTSPYVRGESLVENSQGGFFCRKFSGIQNTLPDHILAVSENGPPQILVRSHIKCVVSWERGGGSKGKISLCHMKTDLRLVRVDLRHVGADFSQVRANFRPVRTDLG